MEVGDLREERLDVPGELRRILEDHEKRLLHLERVIRGTPEVIKRQASVKEFIHQKQAISDLAKTLVIGYYLERYGHVSPFNVRDLVGLFKEAKEPVPQNLNDAVNKNIEKGLIMEAKDKKNNKKSWTLTATGERFVENGLRRETQGHT